MNKGWIKLHRSLIDWEWYSDLNVRALFFHLLLTVNHQDKKWQGRMIKKGSRITGRIQLAKECGLSEQNVRTSIKKLQLTNDLTITKDPKGSMFTVVNWLKYQETNQQINHKNNQPLTSDQPQLKNANKENNVNKEKKESAHDFLFNNHLEELKTQCSNMNKVPKVQHQKLIDSFNDKIELEVVQNKIKFEANQLLPRYRIYINSWINNLEKNRNVNTPEPNSYESGKQPYV